MTAQEINEQLKTSLEKQITVYPVLHLRASSIGHPCTRFLYLQIRHWQEIKPHDYGLQAIFNLGNSLENYTIENIKRAGYEVITPTQRSWQLEVKGGIITGREDIRIKAENGELLPVEIKGISPFEFDKLNSIEDFLTSKKTYIKGYPAQLFIYMLHFGKEIGFFALTNKLTGITKFIEVPFDYDLAEGYLKKAEYIYTCLKNETVPEPCEDIAFCENCPLAHVCGESKRIPADIDLDEELDALIDKKQELAEAKKEYEQVDKEIKKRVGEREKIITGSYVIERKAIFKKAYTVPESTQYRLNIKRL